MSLLGNILGNRRSSGFGGWSRGRSRYGRRGYGRGRAASGGLLGGSLGRIALGGLAAFGLRKVLGNRRASGY
ncbi:hypothetical protein HV824_31665 [Myxococcus sp. AM009]|uniref:hypothetical protein n=1 Tax=unclassified Myxococcus TaxID=2648731 RepID=UPI001595FEF3|nr:MULTISPECIES: hypothetical protein [unclassified Myxococcus]NVJ02653.1 hypothetical protein [Myxococcus sp. AM009]NVJ13226.1 hypothetical protein [Myxococcus sp. AM010]